jgi:putative tricarboxylic transport membrane protein
VSDDTTSPPARAEGVFDRLLAAAWVAGGLACCAYARVLGVFGPSGPDAGFFVMIAGAVLALAGAGLLLSARRRTVPADRWPRGAGARRVLGVLVGAAVLVLAIRWLGFLVASVVTMPILLSVIERRSLVFVVAVGSGSAIAAWVLFGTLLGLPLPRGPWGF